MDSQNSNFLSFVCVWRGEGEGEKGKTERKRETERGRGSLFSLQQAKSLAPLDPLQYS